MQAAATAYLRIKITVNFAEFRIKLRTTPIARPFLRNGGTKEACTDIGALQLLWRPGDKTL